MVQVHKLGILLKKNMVKEVKEVFQVDGSRSLRRIELDQKYDPYVAPSVVYGVTSVRTIGDNVK